jgi:hypothetical protein
MIVSITRLLIACALFASVTLAQDPSSIRDRFKSENYTVAWGVAPCYSKESSLEIGSGSGHGGQLEWLRFRTVDGKVEILSIGLDEGWNPYNSKWGPDSVPVVVKRGSTTAIAYASLLKDIATVSSARITPVQRNRVTMTSSSFWVAARLYANGRTLLDLDWAGYAGSLREPEYVKPEITVALAREAVSKIKLEESSLTPAERRWVSDKFIADWKRLSDRDFYWWVAERLIMIVGVAGGETALPTLIEIMRSNVNGGPSDRRIYYAINAITRITSKDVRPRPVEDMDLESTRRSVLESLKDREK